MELENGWTRLKRWLDALLAGLALLLLIPLFFLVAIVIKLDSRGPVFFFQQRIGRGMRPFWIYKFRTMVADAPRKGTAITLAEDSRVTAVGKWLRKSKIDELPQLINVLKGEMSLVGPRPEVPKYVELYRRDYEEILRIRPGLTDLASLKYRDEAEALREFADPEKGYETVILPDKIRLAKEYLRRSSLRTDIEILLKTLIKVIRPA